METSQEEITKEYQVMVPKFMKEIVALSREHGTMVVHDFAYADIAFDGDSGLARL